MQQEFQKKYDTLNPAQKQAVDAIDGPVLVIAGPGTGKTELLSVRVANILRLTDIDPSSILCLTFTESAQVTMQARLGRLIGPEASQVAIHTFHSFGSHIIGSHGDYFQEAFGFRASDDVTRYELLASLLERLPRDVQLGRLYDGDFIYLKDIQTRISQLKQAGVSPVAFQTMVTQDRAWSKRANALIQDNLAGLDRISAKEIFRFSALATDLLGIPEESGQTIPSLGQLCLEELAGALQDSGGTLTRPITGWKKRWLTKNGTGQFILSATRQMSKLAELAEVYQAYQSELATRRLYDYDDMIVRVIETLTDSPDLRAELQERYQYILVDEYQDTNGAQLRLLKLLADSPVNEGQPNLMVVGDDDQAIYSFQGAYQSNVSDFLSHWPAAKKVVLTRNYRSSKPILRFARQLIIQGEDRLENKQPELDKTLIANDASAAPKPRLELLGSQVEQYGWLARQISSLIQAGQDPRQLAVIAPKHKYLEALVPYLQDQSIAVAYERREDVLQQPHIIQLLTLGRVIVHLANGEISQANNYLPELLSYPWWGLTPGWLWEIALAAKNSRQPWLEVLLGSPRPEMRDVALWLLQQAKASQVQPLEPMMDTLIGPAEPAADFASPYRQYYFGGQTIESSVTYLGLLSGLVSLRGALREYQPDTLVKLSDFVAFADVRFQAGLPLRNDHPLALDVSAVQLLTAHKSKGLEFEHVFVINADEHTWRTERGRNNNIALPPNFSVIKPAGDSADEKLRRLYVAATRARQSLTLTSFVTTNDGKPTVPLGWLQPESVKTTIDSIPLEKHAKENSEELTRQLGFDWLAPHFDMRATAPWSALLRDDMRQYQLSPTHLTAFLDVGRGGPKAFLVNQLLRFPQALSVNAQFGNVMHKLLERLHGQVNSQGKLPSRATADVWLEEIIGGYYFGPIETPKAQRRGQLSLDAVYDQLSDNFRRGQQSEYDFTGEGVTLGAARLKGKIDSLTLDKQARGAVIIDYKTGSAIGRWPVDHQANNYEAHKAHRYRQQLSFYKLLVERSRSFKGYMATSGSLVFVEPDDDQQLHTLEMTYAEEEMGRLERLIQVVYRHISQLDLPDTSGYSQDFHGTLAFEADLLAESN